MIAYLRGKVADLSPTTAVIECAGVGYLAHISLNTYTAIQDQQETKLFIHQVIREDAHLLFGFATQEERLIFTHLISVSGVGPNTARVILSSYTAYELAAIINQGGVAQLKAVKGIGVKTAERIVVDLKGKLLDLGETTPTTPSAVQLGANSSTIVDEAVGALKMLGFAEAAAGKVVRQMLQDQPTLKVEEVIKLSLKLL